ncbi:MAG: PDZ domain-containing protein [Actinomycetota bacterium]|nr:PDZ domain-containing protein [Actinomycetota bacterium]
MLGRVSPVRLLVAGLALLAVVAAVLWLVPSEDYIFLPDRARPVEPLVRVEGERSRAEPGGIYLVDVLVRRASLLERLIPEIRSGSTLVPESAVTPPGVSQQQRRQGDIREMERSQEIGAAVALRALGYRVKASPVGALVAAVIPDTPAVGSVRPGDVIVAANGERVLGPRELRTAMSGSRPGQRVRLTPRAGRKLRRVEVTTVSDPETPRRAIIGVVVEQAATIGLPVRVRIETGNIGGPSAGLAFALDIVDELGRDVTRGRRIAATGQLELDGTVLPVGGLKQKTIGARETGMDVLLVPAGENAAVARRYAEGLTVLPVRTFEQALHTLTTLAGGR